MKNLFLLLGLTLIPSGAFADTRITYDDLVSFIKTELVLDAPEAKWSGNLAVHNSNANGNCEVEIEVAEGYANLIIKAKDQELFSIKTVNTRNEREAELLSYNRTDISVRDGIAERFAQTNFKSTDKKVSNGEVVVYFIRDEIGNISDFSILKTVLEDSKPFDGLAKLMGHHREVLAERSFSCELGKRIL